MKDKIILVLAAFVLAGVFWVQHRMEPLWHEHRYLYSGRAYHHPKIRRPLAVRTAGKDDSNTAHQIPKANAALLANLQTFLGTESGTRFLEAGLINFVDATSRDSIAGACLGSTGAGLTMNLGACLAYNAGIRSTCGVGNNLGLGPGGTVPSATTSDCPGGNAITFPNNSTCWVAMDENTTGNNSGIPTFTRVTGTHYLTDCTSATAPTMAYDSQLLMEVTTASGSITAVSDLRNFSPFTPPVNGVDISVHSITGIGSNPFITKMNGIVQGTINFGTYRPSGSLTTTTCTTDGSATLNCGSTTSFTVGQYVVLKHGAAVNAASAPTPTIAFVTDSATSSIVTAAGCTADTITTACTTQWSVSITAVDTAGGTGSTQTVTTAASGPDVPTARNRIKITWPQTATDAGYKIGICSGAACTPAASAYMPINWHGATATTPCNGCATPGDGIYYYMGRPLPVHDAADASPLLTPSLRQDFYGTVVSVNPDGTHITVSAIPANNPASGLLLAHDDGPLLQSAINAACGIGSGAPSASGAGLYIPPGNYPIGETVNFNNGTCANMALFGLGAEAAGGASAVFVWYGAPGGTMFDMNRTGNVRIEHINAYEVGAVTPGTYFDIDRHTPGATNCTHDIFNDVSVGVAGIQFKVANRASANCENMEFHNIGAGNGALAEAYQMMAVAGVQQTNNFIFEEMSCYQHDICFFFDGLGSAVMDSNSYVNDEIGVYINNTLGKAILDEGTTMESVAQPIYSIFNNGTGVTNQWNSYTLIGAEWEANGVSPTYVTAIPSGHIIAYNAAGLNLINDQIGTRTTPNNSFNVQYITRLVSIGSGYGNLSPYLQLPSNPLTNNLTCLGDYSTFQSGVNQSICNVVASGVITQTMTAAPVTLNWLNDYQRVIVSGTNNIVFGGCLAGETMTLELTYTGSFTPTLTTTGTDAILYRSGGPDATHETFTTVPPTWSAANLKSDMMQFICRYNSIGGMTYTETSRMLTAPTGATPTPVPTATPTPTAAPTNTPAPTPTP